MRYFSSLCFKAYLGDGREPFLQALQPPLMCAEMILEAGGSVKPQVRSC